MICITGAGGTVGSEVLGHMQSSEVPCRAAYFSKEKAERARASGLSTAVIDYRRPETLKQAFEGCTRLFLLGPNTLDQTDLELNAVEAAASVGVRHIVKQSVMGAEEESYSLATVHRPVEKAIEESGLTWTFLRPNSFMQNIATFMSGTIRSEDTLYSATDGATISHVDVRDIAAVARRALTDRAHECRSYVLTGLEAISLDDIAERLSDAVGRSVGHVSLAPADLKSGMLTAGMPEELADRMLDLERYFREGRASGVSDDIRAVTGNEPRRIGDYLREVASSGLLDAKRSSS